MEALRGEMEAASEALSKVRRSLSRSSPRGKVESQPSSGRKLAGIQLSSCDAHSARTRAQASSSSSSLLALTER